MSTQTAQELITPTQAKQELAASGNDPWAGYVKAFDAQSVIQGTLLKFSKGFWTAGSDAKEIKRNTRMTARVDELVHGFTHWKGGKPVEHRIGRLADNFVPPQRRDLGDTDVAAWEPDNKGEPRDPWQYTLYLPMQADGVNYVFSTSSWGGKKAMRNLCDAYSRRRGRDSLPLVELDVFQRKHREFGNIPEPLFDVVGWVSAETGKPQAQVEPEYDDHGAPWNDGIPF